MTDFLSIFLLSTLGSIAGLIGGTVFFLSEKIKNWFCRYSVPFAAGILLTVAILSLTPEAHHEIGETAFLIVLITFLVSYVFEQLFFDIHHHDEHSHRPSKAAVPLVIAGDTIHNFIDGVAIAAAYLTNPGLGLIVALSTFLHETPHEIGDFGVLLAAGWSRSKALLANFLSALSTYLGAFFVIYVAQEAEWFTGSLLAVAAGMFLYLGASDFLPKPTDKKDVNVKKIAALLVGVVIMIVATTLVPHAHE